MKYYRVNREVYDRLTFAESIIGELLTPKERKNFFPTLSDKCFDTVDVKKNETHIFFGARFPNESALVIVYKEMDCI